MLFEDADALERATVGEAAARALDVGVDVLPGVGVDVLLDVAADAADWDDDDADDAVVALELLGAVVGSTILATVGVVLFVTGLLLA